MKIAAIKNENVNFNLLWDYVEKFERTLVDVNRELGGVDVIVGPDYGLYSVELNDEKKIDFVHTLSALELLRILSVKNPETLFLPGTGPKLLNGGKMGLHCPVFLGGKLERELFKESDAGEGDIAKENGLTYFRGNSSDNMLNHNGKDIAVEICSDHGKQRMKIDPFLEVIMAYDKFGGFHIGVNNDDFDRYALVCNSIKNIGCTRDTPNLVECFEYNRQKDPKLRIIEPDVETEDFKAYELKEIKRKA